MTHEELLANIERIKNNVNPQGTFSSVGIEILSAFNALRAVVELHKPEPLDERGNVCLTCCPDLLTLYPCPTIQAIEKELK